MDAGDPSDLPTLADGPIHPGGPRPDPEPEATLAGGRTLDGAPDATIAGPDDGPQPSRPLPAIPGYRVESELGRGGMGVVYRARQVRLNRTVALKMILAGDHASPEASVRFLAEAEAIAKVSHPYIVQIYHIDEHQGRPYFEMEYVGGGSLADRLDGQPRPPEAAAALAAKLARAVAEAHRVGIVHRDLKPANILLTADGTPKVADFGLAKSLAEDSGLTRTDSILGSPSYMSPEQAEGKASTVGAGADIHALGAILYEQLTGRPPFVGATVLDTLQQVKASEPVPPSRLVPGLPRDIETIALKCLEKSPARRYPTALSLADDLDRFLSGEPIVARPVPFWERGWKWAARRPAMAAMGLTLAITAVAALGMGVASYVRIEEALAEARDERSRAVRSQGDEVKARRRAEASREAALSETYRASISEARALRAAHLPGWRDAALGNLARLATLPTPRRDLGELRSEAVACLGDFDIREAARFDGGGEAFGLAFLDGGRTLASAHRHGVHLWDAARPAHRSFVAGTAAPVSGRGWIGPNEPRPRARRWPGLDLLAYNTAEHGLAALRLPDLTSTGLVVDRAFATSRDLAFDAEGRHVAVAWSDGRVDVIDFDRRATRSARTRHRGVMAMHPDGRSLAVCGQDLALLIQPLDGSPPHELGRSRSPVLAMAFSPDGSTLAAASVDGSVTLWDLARKLALFPMLGHKSEVSAAEFSADGSWLATAGLDHTVRVWDARTGRELAVLEQPQFAYTLAFSPGGDALATGCIYDAPARLYRIEGRRERRRLVGHGRGLERLAFDPTRSRLVSGDVAGWMILWDASTGREIRRWQAHASFVNSIDYSDDGRLIASGGGPGDTVVKTWDGGSGRPLRTFEGLKSQVTAIALDRGARRIVGGDYRGHLLAWGVDDGATVGGPIQLPNHVTTLAFVDDRRVLAQVDKGDLWLVDLGNVEAPRPIPIVGGGRTFAIDRGRARVVVEGGDGSLTTISLADFRPIDRVEGAVPGEPIIAAISPDGRLIATGGEGRRVVLSDAATLRPLLTFPPRIGRVKTLDFSRDGRLLGVGGIDSEAEVWDIGLLRDGLDAIGLSWDGPPPEPVQPTESAAVAPREVPTVQVGEEGPVGTKEARERLLAGMAARRAKREESAVADFRAAVDLYRQDATNPATLGNALGWLGGTLASFGRRDEARAALAEACATLESLTSPTPGVLFDLARASSVLSSLGEPDRADRALAALGRAIDAGLPPFVNLAREPDFAPIRDRPEFGRLLLDRAFPRDPFADGPR